MIFLFKQKLLFLVIIFMSSAALYIYIFIFAYLLTNIKNNNLKNDIDLCEQCQFFTQR